MKSYSYISKMKIMVGITYRFDLIIGMVCQILVMLASVYLWNSAYASHETLNGLYQSQMVTYAVLAVVVSTLFSKGVTWSIADGVRHGGIAMYFLRPISMLGMFFADDLGEVISNIFIRAIPTLLLGILFFHVSPPVSAPALLLSLVSVSFSCLIMWFLSCIIGLITFWAMKFGNLGYLKDMVVAILSGALIPIWFFPVQLQNVLNFMPFPYTYQAPIAIYIGQTETLEAFRVIGIQILWSFLLFLLMRFVWSRAKARVIVQGG